MRGSARDDCELPLASLLSLFALLTPVVLQERSAHFVTRENLDARLLEALDNPRVHEFAIDLQGKELRSATPVKYLSGTPTRQKGRLYDRSLVKTRE